MSSCTGSKRKLHTDADAAPQDIHALMQWPLYHVDLLAAHIGLDSLLQRLQAGVAVSTSYSGMGAPEMSMKVLLQGLAVCTCWLSVL